MAPEAGTGQIRLKIRFPSSHTFGKSDDDDAGVDADADVDADLFATRSWSLWLNEVNSTDPARKV